ncbi:MAG TPA: pyridoxal 5'-phosphate synthase glutaminase subunit PdxT, partial [Actinomycetota bacterium]|nr:pyridoxal 5'-phosphate synthase glutaminase subunit PdxT [Actinomycetota bacterium]
GGEGVEVLAAFEGRPVVVVEGPHMASSFHPEMTDDPRIHELFVKKVEAL